MPDRNARRKADAAFEAHQAMLLTEVRFPALRRNPAWEILRAIAYEQFCEAFGKVGAE